MRSQSKVVVDHETLTLITQRHLNKALKYSAELTEGWYNTIYLLELEDESKVVLKISPSRDYTCMRYERGIISTEVKVFQKLAESQIPVPEVVAFSNSGDELGHPWFMMECIEGFAWNNAKTVATPQQQVNVDNDIARLTAALHAIISESFGRFEPDHCTSKRWSESFALMIQDLLLDAKDKNIDLPESADWYRNLIDRTSSILDEVTEPSLVWWDLHDGNVIVNPEKTNVAAFIDPDRAMWADPAMEFCFRSIAQTHESWMANYFEYRAVEGATVKLNDENFLIRNKLYDLYLALVMYIECFYRNYDPDHVKWAREECTKATVNCHDLIT